MEELTHSLLENGSIEKKDTQYVLSRRPSEIPETIQGIIAARIDRLEDSLKKVIQVAAVIGKGLVFFTLQAISGVRGAAPPRSLFPRAISEKAQAQPKLVYCYP
jgi:predicted ATPase